MTGPAAPRRDVLLRVAADLFAERGYHGVGIDDIGAAAGISGPGVYRHFSGKQALLAALCTSAMDRMLAAAQQAVRDAQDAPAAALGALVDLHAAFAVAERALIGVWAREQRALEPAARTELRRSQREYERVWQDVVTPLRPDLEADEVVVVVAAALALLNGSALALGPSPVTQDRRRELLAGAARAALLPAVVAV